MRLIVTVILFAVGGGCAHSKTTSPSQAPAASAEAGLAAPEQQLSSRDSAAEPNARAEFLVVAGPFGIREVGLDGRLVRHLSATPAQRPRLLPSGEVLFLASEGRELRVLERGTRRERSMAPLPMEFEGCTTGPVRLDDLSVQSDHDFVVDEGGDAACIRLQDRNDNMMGIAVDVRIQLGTGRLTYEISYPVECSRETPVKPCQAALTAKSQRGESDRSPFGIRDGALVPHVHAADAQSIPFPPGDWSESVPSPSGRWVVVEGNFHQGDYIYRDLLVLDAQAGNLYRVEEGDISNPLTPQQLDQLGSDSVTTATAPAETTVSWLPERDVLIVGSLLVHPGQTGTDLGGDVAY